MQIMQY